MPPAVPALSDEWGLTGRHQSADGVTFSGTGMFATTHKREEGSSVFSFSILKGYYCYKPET